MIEIKKHSEKNIVAVLPINYNRPATLVGSEKQIAYANDLLDLVLSILKSTNNAHYMKLPEGIDTEDPRMQPALENWQKIYQEKYDAFFAHKEAWFYIDKLKNFSGNANSSAIQLRMTTSSQYD